MPTMTTRAAERAVARLLGAPEDVAAAAVAAIEQSDALAHGVLLLAVMGAARWGTDAPGALARLADGATVPANWSDYELRVAAAEADDERADALGRLRIDATLAAEAADLDEAVAQLLAGRGSLRVTVPLAVPEQAFLEALCARAGAVLDALPPSDDDTGVRVSDAWLDLMG
jgi:hypothetical protein